MSAPTPPPGWGGAGFGYPPQGPRSQPPETGPAGHLQQAPGYGAAPGYPPPGFTMAGSSWPPASPAGFAAGPPRPGRRSAPLVVSLIVGVVIGAGVMTALALTGVIGSSKASVNTEPITLPSSLPGMVLQADALQKASGAGGKTRPEIDHLETARQATIAQVSEAYDGAAVDVQFYSTVDLETFSTVHAIRAPSPGPTVQSVEDAEYTGLATPFIQIITTGDVDCYVNRVQVVPSGQEVKPEDLTPALCQKSTEDLTVKVFSGSGITVDDAVATVNDVWSSLTG